jgi:hypothetical protein
VLAWCRSFLARERGTPDLDLILVFFGSWLAHSLFGLDQGSSFFCLCSTQALRSGAVQASPTAQSRCLNLTSQSTRACVVQSDVHACICSVPRSALSFLIECELLQDEASLFLNRRIKRLNDSWFKLFFRDDFPNASTRCSVKCL